MSGGLWDLVLPASRTGQVVRQTECDQERQTRHDRRANTNQNRGDGYRVDALDPGRLYDTPVSGERVWDVFRTPDKNV